MHARPVRVEYPGDLDTQFVLAPIIKEQRLGAALTFIVTGTWTNRVDVAPIVLGLRMNAGIAVYFGGRGLEDFSSQSFSQSQHIDRAVDAGFGGLHGIVLIVDRRCGTRQIVNFVHFDIQRKGNIVPDHLEIFMVKELFDISTDASKEIVDTHDYCSVGKQVLA